MFISDSSGISKMRRMLIILALAVGVAVVVAALGTLTALVVAALGVVVAVAVAVVALAVFGAVSRRLCLHDGHVLFNRSQ